MTTITWGEAWEFALGSVQRFAMQDVPEFAEALRQASAIGPKIVLEIGSANGGSLYGWSKIAPEVIAISEAEPAAPYGGELDAHGANVGRFDSHSPEARDWLTKQLKGRQVDVLFIDGDHSYNGVRADYEDYSAFVRPGGLIMIHDIAHDGMELTEPVSRFWAQLDIAKREIVNPELAEPVGIGVIERRPDKPPIARQVPKRMTTAARPAKPTAA